ncbi:hypothetical protein SAMN03097699_2043 [Flavobacteriaceae bacterium MAR_2010_188]|nr:hypothetical protein SAMN03097699_2043 [Flavobacteriaceae bacterium MAR_2010_188]
MPPKKGPRYPPRSIVPSWKIGRLEIVSTVRIKHRSVIAHYFKRLKAIRNSARRLVCENRIW